ncbi:MAG: hypothetical protein COA80_11750, partial [Leeuwenhoekiella sp.]
MNIITRSLYTNLLRVKFLDFLNEEEFKFYLIEQNLDEYWNSLLDKSYSKNDWEVIDMGAPEFSINYEKCLFNFLEGISNRDDFYNLIQKLLLEYFYWTKQEHNIERLIDWINAAFINSEYLQTRIIELNKKILERKNENLKPQGRLIIYDDEEINDDLNPPIDSKKVFIVHGHDELDRYKLRDYIRDDLKLNPVIIQEKPNETFQTIFAKFERDAKQCSVVIILATPDDEMANKKYRARQNVILELGYFLGRFSNDEKRKII